LPSCAGRALYSPPFTHFVFITHQTPHIFLTPPKLIENPTPQTLSPHPLPPPTLHHHTTRNLHYTAKDHKHLLKAVPTL
ncbi:carboxyl transferase domain-containing protein, partial [Bacillus pumilus]|uniref:carboxyl transferase domain-containing protein n=1 Tax=Bacillus pumilus TaxID=1408 RepID=UPI003704697F